MKEPIEIIENLRKGVFTEEWVKNLYGMEEFEFKISSGRNTINSEVKQLKYKKKLEDLSPHEIKYLIEAWLSRFDNSPKLDKTKNLI